MSFMVGMICDAGEYRARLDRARRLIEEYREKDKARSLECDSLRRYSEEMKYLPGEPVEESEVVGRK